MNQARLHPTTMARFMERDRRVLWAILLGIAAVCFLLGWYAERQLEVLIADRLQFYLQKTGKKFGVSIDVGATDIHPTSIVLSGVTIGDDQFAIVDRVEVSVVLNPFSPMFLRLGRVDIGKVTVKERVTRGERLRWLQTIFENYRKTPNDAPSSSRAHALIPPEISLKAAKIILADGNDEHTIVSGLSGTIVVVERKIIWWAERIVAAPYIEEEFLEGRLTLKDPSRITGMIRHRPHFSGKPRWRFECERVARSPRIVCDVDAETMPQTFVQFLRPYLGKDFAPGMHGSLGFTQKGGKIFDVDVDADLTGLKLEHKSLSIDPIGPFTVGSKLHMEMNLNDQSLVAKDIKVAIAPDLVNERSVGFEVDADLKRDASHPDLPLVGDVHVRLPRTRCDDVLKAVPPGFAPDLAGINLTGDMSLVADATFADGRMDFKWGQTMIECKVGTVPEIYTREYLNGPFVLERTFGPDRVVHIPVDPSQGDYTALRDIPNHVVSAFVTSEDAGFWQHTGIEPSAIVQALERNAREGRAAVGGSTITMQTVKNLFLSRDKNLSRKAQEIFLAWHLEQAIGKQRILEIYLNVVEFGPELYGIGAAAKRFFGLTPRQLSLKQAVYMASLLPAPVPRYQYFCRGSLTDNYSNLVDILLRRILSLGRISSETYATAAAEPIAFVAERQDPYCQKTPKARVGDEVKTPSDEDEPLSDLE